MSHPDLLKVYVDADVLFRAATASHHFTVALVLLRMSEFTLLDAITAVHTVEETTRNLGHFLPSSRPALLQFLARALTVVDDPPAELLQEYQAQAHWKDVINLAAAAHVGAHVLVTFNVRDYYPASGMPRVMPPGELVATTRLLLHKTFSRL